MVFIYIIAGLLGLGIIVFIHELGHFIAAKNVGIEVEAFAIGWGPPILSYKKGETDYRLCAFPLGGYCKMKGDSILEKKLDGKVIEPEEYEKSIFGATPLQRIITYIAGPLSNALFAVILFTFVWIIGTEYQSYNSKIVILSDYPTVFSNRTDYPSVKAGLTSGDIITKINGKQIENYRQIQDIISKNPEKELAVEYIHDRNNYQTVIIPELNKKTGTGLIGIAPWIVPEISETEPGRPAHISGIRSGDKIIAINGKPVEHYIEISSILMDDTDNIKPVFTIMRNNEKLKIPLILPNSFDSSLDLGITYKGLNYSEIERNPIKALIKGIKDTLEVFYLSFQGIALLFKGIDIKETVSGPLRITYTVGQYAVFGFSNGFTKGIVSLFRFISFISVALCFMNLLPLPALDGGMIMYNGIELIRKKPLSAKAFYRFQTVGVIIIGILLFSSLYNDIRFFFFK